MVSNVLLYAVRQSCRWLRMPTCSCHASLTINCLAASPEDRTRVCMALPLILAYAAVLLTTHGMQGRRH